MSIMGKIYMTPALKEYHERLQETAQNRRDTLISNDGVEKAAVLLSTIFDNANDHVNIFASSLRSELTDYDIYRDALDDCISRGVKVRVLLGDQDARDKSKTRIYLEELSKKEGSNVELRSGNQYVVDMEEHIHDDAHFTTADGRMYRIEYDIDNFKAVASFDSKALVEVFDSAFDAVWNGMSA